MFIAVVLAMAFVGVQSHPYGFKEGTLFIGGHGQLKVKIREHHVCGVEHCLYFCGANHVSFVYFTNEATKRFQKGFNRGDYL